jgi:hypothetical protein
MMPAHSSTAGRIIREEAYALSKMLDSSGWNGLLRQKITPSDIDLMFDNDGSVLYVDFSITYDNWNDLGQALKGQRRAYESNIRYGPHCAAVCKHSVTPEMGRRIDTFRDVDRFQAMIWDFEPVLSPIFDGALWSTFVKVWVNERKGPLRIRRSVLAPSETAITSRRSWTGTSPLTLAATVRQASSFKKPAGWKVEPWRLMQAQLAEAACCLEARIDD